MGWSAGLQKKRCAKSVKSVKSPFLGAGLPMLLSLSLLDCGLMGGRGKPSPLFDQGDQIL